jgi:hypothetical protein
VEKVNKELRGEICWQIIELGSDYIQKRFQWEKCRGEGNFEVGKPYIDYGNN